MTAETIARKDHHLEICAGEDVECSDPGALFDDVSLIHEALPELSLDALDTGTAFLGRHLRLPLMATAITGGTERGGEFNRALARAAEKFGFALGLGSQRAMAERSETAQTFCLRDCAPDAVIVGNIGLWQAREMGRERVRDLMEKAGCDAMALHLNAAQELMQPEGDRDFSGTEKVIADLAEAFGDRLIVKETGCGISPKTACRLVRLGVKAIDISGLGGTSWIQVEAHRIRPDAPHAHCARRLAGEFSSWGIPTAPCIAAVREAVGEDVFLIASGGVRTGLDMAKAIALGANLAGAALPFLRSWTEGGEEALDGTAAAMATGLKAAMALTGSVRTSDLRQLTCVEGSRFERWKAALLKSSKVRGAPA